MIDIRALTIAYRTLSGETLLAVDGVDLAVARGEFVAVVGPSGCGKSTILKVLSGLLVPTSGEASVGGAAVREPRADVGVVFQEPRLLPWRTTAENVAYPLELAGVARGERDARVERLLETVGLQGAAGVIPSRLSGGMRQRAALARTLATEPAVLLLDEPFSALDELTRERLNLELLEIAARHGSTVLIVTHSVQEAIFLADRVIVLSERPGRVVADVAVGLARPRSLGDLDAAVVSAAAAAIRALLGAEPAPVRRPADELAHDRGAAA